MAKKNLLLGLSVAAAEKKTADFNHQTVFKSPDGYEIDSYHPFGEPSNGLNYTLWPPKGNAVGTFNTLEEAQLGIEQWKQFGDPELLKRDGGARFKLHKPKQHGNPEGIRTGATAEADVPETDVPVWCYDNGGETADRYTIVFTETGHEGTTGGFVYDAVGAGDDVSSPQGFYQHTEAKAGAHLGKEISIYALPEALQERIFKDLEDMDPWGEPGPKPGDPSEPPNLEASEKEGAAGAAPALAPTGVTLRQPSQSEMEHERMRFNQAAQKPGEIETYLQRRLHSISNPQKLFAFALMLENENFHTFNQQVFDKLKALGWNGQWPKGASAKKASGQHNWVIKDHTTQCEHCGAPWSMDIASASCPKRASVKQAEGINNEVAMAGVAIDGGMITMDSGATPPVSPMESMQHRGSEEHTFVPHANQAEDSSCKVCKGKYDAPQHSKKAAKSSGPPVDEEAVVHGWEGSSIIAVTRGSNPEAPGTPMVMFVDTWEPASEHTPEQLAKVFTAKGRYEFYDGQGHGGGSPYIFMGEGTLAKGEKLVEYFEEKFSEWQEQQADEIQQEEDLNETPVEGAVKEAGPMDVEDPQMAVSGKMHPFDKNDWNGFAGAESFEDGEEPYIGEADATNWPEDLSQMGNGVIIIVDAKGICLHGVDGEFIADFGSKEQNLEVANGFMAHGVDGDQIMEDGRWDTVNMANDTMGDIEDKANAQQYVDMAGGKPEGQVGPTEPTGSDAAYKHTGAVDGLKLDPVTRETLQYAAQYLEHPDVVAIPFALPSSNVARALRGIIKKYGAEKDAAYVGHDPNNSGQSPATEVLTGSEEKTAAPKTVAWQNKIWEVEPAESPDHVRLVAWKSTGSPGTEARDQAPRYIDDIVEMAKSYFDQNVDDDPLNVQRELEEEGRQDRELHEEAI